MKITPYIAAAVLLSAPLYLNSCSVVSQARKVDVSSIPGLGAVLKSQDNMMEQYASSSRLLLQSRLSALKALELDAQAYADAKQAGKEYDKAVSIAAAARSKMDEVNAELTNIQNKPDLDAVSKAIAKTKDVDDIVKEGYADLSAIAGTANAAVNAQNAKGDSLVMSAVQHVDAANASIAESYRLLQDAQWAEAQLTLTAVEQSNALVKAMEGASSLDKAALGVTFRPIVYFLTGLPDEFAEQGNIKDMWENHAQQVSGLKLPSRKQMPDVKAKAASAAAKVTSSFTPSISSFF